MNPSLRMEQGSALAGNKTVHDGQYLNVKVQISKNVGQFTMQVIKWQEHKIHRLSLEISQVLLKISGGTEI